MKNYYTYILSNRKRGTIYIGVTNNLINRVNDHKKGLIEGFTQKYKVNRLVYYEIADYVYDAISREKQLKNWHRQWKINLIESSNPEWQDLYDDLVNRS